MNVTNLLTVNTPEKWDDPILCNIFELHLDYINKNYELNTVVAQNLQALKYRGNLYGLLTELKIPEKLHKFTAYLNGYNNPQDFNGTQTVFRVVPDKIYQTLDSLY